MKRYAIDLSDVLARTTITARRYGIPVKNHRYWAARLKLATWLFHAACLMAGMKFEEEE